MFKIIKILTINLILFFFGIIILEIIFGSWLKQSNYSDLLIPKKQINLIDNFPYEHPGLGIYSRDKNGFRANKYSLNQINILVLGGSTTEEREVDDKKIWTKIFEKNLKKNFKVLNAGIGGQTSLGHKTMFKIWFNKLTNLKPDFIIVYLGINDALYLVESINNKDLILKGRELNTSNRDNLVNTNRFHRIIQYIKNNSVFHDLYLIIKGNIITSKYKVSYDSTPKIFKTNETAIPDNINNLNEKHMYNFEKYYLNNLFGILDNSKKYNAKVIFITQKISNQHWLKEYLKKINLITSKFCKNSNAYCINLDTKELKIENEHFYDGIHTTADGSRIIGQFIANEFNKFYINE